MTVPSETSACQDIEDGGNGVGDLQAVYGLRTLTRGIYWPGLRCIGKV
jgi:hypothetical protein